MRLRQMWQNKKVLYKNQSRVDRSAMIETLSSSQNVLPLVLAILTAIGLFFMYLNIRLFITGRQYRRLMKGTRGANLEALLKETLEICEGMQGRLKHLEDGAGSLIAAQEASLQGVGFVRFNAFADRGDMSFALALLNRHGDGVVFCCISSRDDCRLYARQVVGGVSPVPLSSEEKEAIQEALAAARKR